jgi:hypothetical protein
MNPKQVTWGIIAGMACLFAQPARATPHDTKFLRIIDIGCHQVNDHCYVTLSEPVAVDIDCTYSKTTTSQLRWDDPDQPKGQRTFAALYAAFLAGRSVSLQVAGCSGSGYATFGYYHIQ